MTRIARISPLLAAVALAGCPYPEAGGCGEKEFRRDADGDGFGAGEAEALAWCDGVPDGYLPADAPDGDCDDGDAAVNPGATEVCNGVDDDCDPSTDESSTDADDDGAPTCLAGVPHDCDDDDPARFPGATEILCDGIDNDCYSENADAPDVDEDGLTLCDGDCHDGDVPPGFESDLHPDDDGDGHGAKNVPNGACPDPDWVASSDDCDDGDRSVHPGVAEATCNGVDDNCDGPADEDPDADGDLVGACTGDCDDTNPAVHEGAPEIGCNQVDDNCSGTNDDDILDGDGDGEACDTDCDDTVGERSHAAAEICDGTDNDCDGFSDEDVTVDGYEDGDGDGFAADGAAPRVGCPGQPGFATERGDCDDTAADLFPDALEACDGFDNDCDGAIDWNDSDYGEAPENCGDGLDTDCDGEEDRGQLPFDDASPMFNDTDQDGLGAASEASAPLFYLCDSVPTPASFSRFAEDCDDLNDRIPAAAETCDDDRDDDCNGEIDEGATAAPMIWYWDEDGDGWGDSDRTGTLCPEHADPYDWVAADGDCDDAYDTGSGINPGVDDPPGDGIDPNCDGVDGLDPDGDGIASATNGGEDCDDQDRFIPASLSVCGVTDATCNGDPAEGECLSQLAVDAGFTGAGVAIRPTALRDLALGAGGPEVVLGFWDLSEGATDELVVLEDSVADARYTVSLRFTAPAPHQPGYDRLPWAGGAMQGVAAAIDGQGGPDLAIVDASPEASGVGATLWILQDPIAGGTLPLPDASSTDPAFVLSSQGCRDGYALAAGALVGTGEEDLVVTAPNFEAETSYFWIAEGGSAPTDAGELVRFVVEDDTLDALGLDAALTPDLDGAASPALALLSGGIANDGTTVVVYAGDDLSGYLPGDHAAPAPLFRFVTGDTFDSHQDGPRVIFADLDSDALRDDLLVLSPRHDGATLYFVIDPLSDLPQAVTADRTVEIEEDCGGGLLYQAPYVYVGCRQLPNYEGTIFAIHDDATGPLTNANSGQLRPTGNANYLGGGLALVDYAGNGEPELLATTAQGWVWFPDFTP